MRDFITVEAAGRQARLAARPINEQEYQAYLSATGGAVPRDLAYTLSHGAGYEPITYVSQVEAQAFLQWLGQQEGEEYRLPSTAELLALAEPDGPVGVSPELWPHTHGDRPEVQGAYGALYLCEWTRESETVPAYGRGEARVLGSVFYPPWLRVGNNPKQVQGMLLASQGFSFVSFRAAIIPA